MPRKTKEDTSPLAAILKVMAEHSQAEHIDEWTDESAIARVYKDLTDRYQALVARVDDEGTSNASHTPSVQPADIFLCHSSKDKSFVRRLADDLLTLGVRAWFDEWELGAGDSLHGSIGEALEASAYVGVVLSPSSVKSNWCQKELRQALSRESRACSKVVIPLRYKDVQIPAFLEDKVYLDFRASYVRAIAQLAAMIHNLNQRLLAKALATTSPKKIEDVKAILTELGWSNKTLIKPRHWKELKKILGEYDLHIDPDGFAIMPDVNSGRWRHAAE